MPKLDYLFFDIPCTVITLAIDLPGGKRKRKMNIKAQLNAAK